MIAYQRSNSASSMLMIGAVLMVGVAVLIATPASAKLTRPAPVAGEIVSVNGNETVRFVTETDWRAAERTQELLTGDTLRTGPFGALALRFTDQTLIRMHRNSELVVKVLPSDGTAKLQLDAGRIWARATLGKASVEVRTPSATAAIRGTDWSLEVLGDGSTRLIVGAGTVELRNDLGRVTVTAGEAAVAAIGRAPSKIVLARPPGREQFLYHVSARDIFSSMQPGGGSSAKARARAREIKAKSPGSRFAEDWVDLAEISLTLDGQDAAKDAIVRARQIGGLSEEQEAQLQLVEAMIAGQQMHWAKAEQGFANAAPKLIGDDLTMARFARYIALILGGRSQEATVAFSQFAATPRTATKALSRAWIEALSGELTAAVEIVRSAQGQYSDNVDFPVFAAQIAILQGDETAARAWVKQAMGIDPDSPETLRVKALIESDYDWNAPAAISSLRKAISIAPGNADLWNELALVLYGNADLGGARRAFERAIALGPMDPVPRANYAIMLLDANDLKAAETQIERTLALDPSYYVALLAKGRLMMQRGQLDAAREILLNAVVANPLLSESTLGLAINDYQMGDERRANQALDAAERLDPHDPLVPLVRTVIALDRADADAAIINARKAFDRFRARGGMFNPFAATQSSGSYLTTAFAQLSLLDWSRFYGDLLFSPFDSGSHFYQATAPRSPIAVNRSLLDIPVNRPSLFQGLLLEPLSVAARNRFTDLFRRPFIDVSLGGTVTLDDHGEAAWGTDANVQGFVNGSMPAAFFTAYNHADANLEQSDSVDQFDSAILFVGANVGLTNRLLAWGTFAREDDNIAKRALPEGADDDNKQRAYETGLGYSHSFGARNIFNAVLAYSHGKQEIDSIRILPFDFNTKIELNGKNDTLFLGLAHNVDFGGLILRYGLEGQRIDQKINQNETLFLSGMPQFASRLSDASTPLLGQAYVDLSMPFSENLIVAGGLFVMHFEDGLDTAFSRMQPRIGVACLLFDRHWLRLGYREDVELGFTNSLAPQTVVGLTPGATPLSPGGETRSVLARWDAEWNKHFLTSVELEHQDIEGYQVDLHDSLPGFAAEKGRLKRLTVSANGWLGHGIGLFGSMTLLDSEITKGEGKDQRLPLVPDWIATAGLTWIHPSQLSVTLTETLIGKREGGIDADRLDFVPVTNVAIVWQPLDKHLEFGLTISNLFDKDFDLATNAPALRRTVVLNGRVQF